MKYDFFVDTYKDTNIIAAYFIAEESANTITVLNVHEIEDDSKIYISGRIPYFINPFLINLAKSQVTILGDVEGKPGFKWLSIPYWIFKKNPLLRVVRLNKNKLITLKKSQVNKFFLNKLEDPALFAYFKALGNEDDIDKIIWIRDRMKRDLLESTGTAGSGDVVNSVIGGEYGSGDVDRPMKSRRKRKKGTAREVSDLRDLGSDDIGGYKITKFKHFKNDKKMG